MDSEIKDILKSICFRHGWCYAVFWRYDPINSLLLKFEEAHNDEQSASLVVDMILETHNLGQGIVGQVAVTGNYQWLFSDTLLQCEHEFQNQFLSGLKTIAIIPVTSNGIVQLGSTQKIFESQEMLQQIHEMFLKQDHSSDLDTLFESLVPLKDYEMFPESLQGYTFEDIFNDDKPPSLLSPGVLFSDKTNEPPLVPSPHQVEQVTNGKDEFGFDILNSYSLDDLYTLLADSPEQNNQESSVLIQGNDDKDLFDILGINSEVSSSVSASPPKGIFSELISSSLSSNITTCSSSLTSVQEDYYNNSCLNQSKRRKFETSSTYSSSFFPQMMSQVRTVPPSPLWIDGERSSITGNWKKPHEEGMKKKRAKPGESRRPRPKDRQMIQDRIKELRGMIPNGAKCSIDTLLDLTIKHMLYMQSVAKYGDKLKQPFESKLVKEKERTWALEVGDDESVLCPIIVEDLKPQGQMQIEMVCEESGEFLEIADVVKGLGLDILKGVMETRQDQIWAHFIVEAKPHITRIQVLCSLVHLFQQQHSSSSS